MKDRREMDRAYTEIGPGDGTYSCLHPLLVWLPGSLWLAPVGWTGGWAGWTSLGLIQQGSPPRLNLMRGA